MWLKSGAAAAASIHNKLNPTGTLMAADTGVSGCLLDGVVYKRALQLNMLAAHMQMPILELFLTRSGSMIRRLTSMSCYRQSTSGRSASAEL